MGVLVRYKLGGGVDTTATFKKAGVVRDPTYVVVKVRDPDGDITTYTYGTDATVTKTSTGVYAFSFAVDQAGDWWFRYEGTGEVVAADEQIVQVSGSKFYT
jgi:hypothetical protein